MLLFFLPINKKRDFFLVTVKIWIFHAELTKITIFNDKRQTEENHDFHDCYASVNIYIYQPQTHLPNAQVQIFIQICRSQIWQNGVQKKSRNHFCKKTCLCFTSSVTLYFCLMTKELSRVPKIGLNS